MTPFLQQVATLFYQRYETTIHRLAFVFPNQRSGLFFRKYLSQQTQKPLFSPTILTINELFFRLNDKQPADRIRMLFLLYKIYIRHSHANESFDDFVFWGEMLLNDFNDIDKYLVNAAHLFTNIKDIHQIDSDFSYLQPEQIEAIRSFWSTFQPKGYEKNEGKEPPPAPPPKGDKNSDLPQPPPKGDMENFLDIWQHLNDIYMDFRQELAAEGIGYEGMIFREVVEHIKAREKDLPLRPLQRGIEDLPPPPPKGDMALPYEKIVFVGLNALSTSEKELMKALQKQGIADFYWDCGPISPSGGGNRGNRGNWESGALSPFGGGAGGGSLSPLLDKENKASFFVREHLKMFPSAHPLPEEAHCWPEIELIGIPSRIGQTKQIYPILKEMLVGNTTPDPEEALRTAIVLPDEQLLIPVLHSIPAEFSRINVTLGYSLSETPIASLMESILDLQKKIRQKDNQTLFYHREVLSLLNHQYIASACPDEVAILIQDITKHNKVFIPASDLNVSLLPGLIFQPITSVHEISDYLIRILKELNRFFSTQYGETEEDEHKASSMNELEQEFVYHYFTMVNRLKDMINAGKIQMSIETFFRLLKRLTDSITIPFYGKPLSGIQVMGVLETRVLDFERLIILSMNEGVFPKKTTAGSFIPYNLRRGFGLPVYDHQDSVWAYHFYRMIARAKKVSLLYDTRTEGLQTGEVSRFVHQLKYQYGVPVKDKLMVFNISSTQPIALQIEKTTEVMSKMRAYLTGGGKALSATTINTYIDCPLRFYFATIEGLKEDEDVSEGVDNRIFGTMFHSVAEWLYKPFYGSVVTAELLKQRAKESIITEAIHRAFSDHFFHTKEVRSLSGQHYLTGEMIRKYVHKLLERDNALTPFRYIQAEEKIQLPFRLTNQMEVQLKGYIDRIDEVNSTLRVVDYKTGAKKPLILKSIENLFDPMDKKRPAAILQVFMYAFMYRQHDVLNPIQPTLYYVRDFFSNDFNPIILQEKTKEPVNDFALYRDAFEDGLRSCLDNMFDSKIPFIQTSNTTLCGYCPFEQVCGKSGFAR